MLELSPLDTATNAPASLMPASSRTSRSNPRPTIWRASKPGGSLSNASWRLSMMVTEWPPLASCTVSAAPTRPHPMITMCTAGKSSAGGPYLALGPSDHVHVHVRGSPNEAGDERAPDELLPPGAQGLPDQDLGHVLAVGEREHRLD